MSLFFKNSLCIGLTLLVTACSPFGRDNTPQPTALASFTPTITTTKLWNKKVGGLAKDHYLRFSLALYQDCLFSTDAKGSIIATAIDTGMPRWRTDLKTNITSGVGVGEGIVVVTSADAKLYSLDVQTGKILWQVSLANQALAVPTVAKGLILVKTIDDQVFAFDAKNGKERWTFATGAPQLILSFSSSPIVVDDKVVIGSASGKIFVLSLAEGAILWEQALALPKGANEVQQMVDIDVNPVVQNDVIYVATYQGNMVALRLDTGVILWHQKLSSYTGIAVNNDRLFITDADSHLWLFKKAKGAVVWKQAKLAYRQLTAPALIREDVVVGDSQGYVHILSHQTGECAARFRVANDAIIATPIIQADKMYVLTRGGMLAAYKIG